jgi:hypothetical protein
MLTSSLLLLLHAQKRQLLRLFIWDLEKISRMEHFSRFASSLGSSVSSTVFSTVSAVKDVLPGNPVTREFEVIEHIASAGPSKKTR